MISADLLQVAYMLGSAAVGWLVRHIFGSPLTPSTPTSGTPTQPILNFLQQLTQSRQQSDEVLNLLRQFVNGPAPAPTTPTPPPSVSGNTVASH